MHRNRTLITLTLTWIIMLLALLSINLLQYTAEPNAPAGTIRTLHTAVHELDQEQDLTRQDMRQGFQDMQQQFADTQDEIQQILRQPLFESQDTDGQQEPETSRNTSSTRPERQ